MVDLGRPTADVPSRGYQLWVTDVVVVIVAGIFVAIRLVSRYLRSGIQVDDWTILAALVLSVLFSTTQNVAVGYGFGKHDWDITDEQEKKSLKWILVAQVLYKLVICLAKVSILLLYLRIFYVHQYFRRICICLVVFTILSGIAFIPPTIWQCSPVEAYWDRSIPHTCLSSFPNWLSAADSASAADEARQDCLDTGVPSRIIRVYNQHLPGDFGRNIFRHHRRDMGDDADIELERGGGQLGHHLRLSTDGPADALARLLMLPASADHEELVHLAIAGLQQQLGALLSRLTGQQTGLWLWTQPHRTPVGVPPTHPRRGGADVDPVRQTPAPPSLGQRGGDARTGLLSG
ncbi:TPA_exp: Uncharacterized protein A8136_6080 [Trichophyton benhamiae CBS 112371]|nr:TPA_exp: Uncharacterized protein A8136_6080 [Trichophyton benhamiae CBS 112371]